MIAAGIGCRPTSSARDLVAAVHAALAAAGRELSEVSALYAMEARRDSDALRAAALELGKSLHWLEHAQLVAESAHVLTRSARVQQRLGVPSIAETAALAGARAIGRDGHPRLLGTRSAVGAATCALAICEPQP